MERLLEPFETNPRDSWTSLTNWYMVVQHDIAYAMALCTKMTAYFAPHIARSWNSSIDFNHVIVMSFLNLGAVTVVSCVL